MTNKRKKRFIAGATCPKCQSMDTLMLFFENNVEKMQCVQCNYTEAQTQQNVDDAIRANEDVIGVFKP